ncbi:hypothetical protein Mnod_3256 [Methylobacterium nodulans ORS 2060]|uniref:Uncharacterized protein n=1 Tax=Methylobacterium nodulans (strain LMG 21967 / CNCM I-2342 / ORS 2060) TaxID=460265 RepID=B8IKZ2_METNO|nr:hypothetical protein Mnod_3256 [Methylobacterium nodulans ORS 2060]
MANLAALDSREPTPRVSGSRQGLQPMQMSRTAYMPLGVPSFRFGSRPLAISGRLGADCVGRLPVTSTLGGT